MMDEFPFILIFSEPFPRNILIFSELSNFLIITSENQNPRRQWVCGHNSRNPDSGMEIAFIFMD
jgi:hypothetical protein